MVMLCVESFEKLWNVREMSTCREAMCVDVWYYRAIRPSRSNGNAQAELPLGAKSSCCWAVAAAAVGEISTANQASECFEEATSACIAVSRRHNMAEFLKRTRCAK